MSLRSAISFIMQQNLMVFSVAPPCLASLPAAIKAQGNIWTGQDMQISLLTSACNRDADISGIQLCIKSSTCV